MSSIAISFENVVKSFGAKTILRGVSFEISAGEIAFILGTSGTGKSVTLKNIVGLMKPDSGKIFIEGSNIAEYSEDELFEVRKICGMVFQHPALFDSLSVYENVAYGVRRHFRVDEAELRLRVEKSLTAVNVSGLDDELPAALSYGMQKRVSLARTLAVQPRILLFDEPTTGLDPVTTSAVNYLIQNLSRELKTTSVVVSHDMRCALEIADRVIVLDKGQVIENSSVTDIKKSRHPLVQEFLAEILAEENMV